MALTNVCKLFHVDWVLIFIFTQLEVYHFRLLYSFTFPNYELLPFYIIKTFCEILHSDREHFSSHREVRTKQF